MKSERVKNGACRLAVGTLTVNILIGLATVLISACADEVPRGPSGPPPSKTEAYYSGEGALSATVNTLPLPNQYQVVLRWAENPNAVAWVVSRAEKNDLGPLQLVTLEKDILTFTDEKIKGGQTYRYLLTCLEHEQYRKVTEIALTIPLDMELSTSEPITEIRGINRLFIKKAITSNGEPLTIDVNQIITKV
ncbi:MAG: hypothetical protein HY537_05175, partial [Deltaproteobacteria bacterium]|nr:hypothetical protein [Deltaproteobacteria bacterium]